MQRIALLALGVSFAMGPTELLAQFSVTLQPSVASPSPAGSIVSWTASATGSSGASLVYRWRVRRSGSPFRTVIDFGPNDRFDWTEVGHDGKFEIEVSVRPRDGGASALATATHVLRTEAAEGAPALTNTAHPLVLLYSAPACDPPGRMKVRFQLLDGPRQETPYLPCRDGAGMTFYLGGLLPGSYYLAYHTLDTGDDFEDGPIVHAVTGSLPDLPASQVLTPPPADSPFPILLQLNVFTNSVAVDQSGRIVWFFKDVPDFITRPTGDGRFFTLFLSRTGGTWNRFLREIDLTGRTVRQTNVGRVNEQLAAAGKEKISSFHHDAVQFPDGTIGLITGIEKTIDDPQGSGKINVLGDGIVVLDSNLQLLWAWSAFDHLDVRRQATLDDRCNAQACPPLDVDPNARDWTHANSLHLGPDGNLLLSVRNQDWVIKIDYRYGEGSGRVLWKLGKDGDFTLSGAPASGWFSHQHDARFEPGSETRLLIYDNGNTRRDADPNALSRGQVLILDEQNRTASLAVNVELPYSLALGSAQKLPNGNYFFDSGFLPDASGDAIETTPSGTRVFALKTRAPIYRSYRVPNIYASVP